MTELHPTALAVFCVFFAGVTLAGFWAARWRRPARRHSHAWRSGGLAGRSFGTWITWFLIGGDLYTAYTVIAVPAALYGAGALGFFAVPVRHPRLPLHDARPPAHLDASATATATSPLPTSFSGRFLPPLTTAIALTGILALMPYIALAARRHARRHRRHRHSWRVAPRPSPS